MYKYPQEFQLEFPTPSCLRRFGLIKSIMVIHPTQLGEKLTEESTHILNCNWDKDINYIYYYDGIAINRDKYMLRRSTR